MTTKHRVIQMGPIAGAPNADERLKAKYDVFELWKQPDPAAALAAHGKGVRAVVTTASKGCPAQVIEALPDLQAICSWGVGYDTIDVDAAARRGVQVSNTPDVLTDCVADLAWALMLACARRVGQGERFVRGGQWGVAPGNIPLGIRVSGKKLGILGMGRIGAAIAERGKGFGMQVRYHNRRRREDSPYAYAATPTELAQWADFLVVATVGGAGTRHLVSREVLDALGPRGIIVNIARGSVIDEQAMVQALADGRLGGAGLDVFEREPTVPEPLKSMDNVVLLPHIGSASEETRQAMTDLMFDNLADFFATGKVRTPVQ